MAEALGIAASVVSLAALAAKVCSAISNIRAVQALPARLYALNNEVTDIQGVLRYTSKVLAERKYLPDDGLAKLPAMLERAEIALVRTLESVDRVSKHCVQGKMFMVRAASWWKEKAQLQALQEDLHIIKASLNLLLGASISQDMMRVQLELQEVSLITSTMTENQIDATQESHERHQQMMFMLQDNRQIVEQRFQDIEHTLQQQLSGLYLDRNEKSGASSADDAPRQRQSIKPRASLGDGRKRLPRSGVQFGGVRIRALSYDRVTCQAWCRCICHVERSLASSGTVEHILGRLFVGYAGLPLVSKPCNNISCRRRQTMSVSMEYWFPPWFLHHIVRLDIALPSAAGLHVHLRTLRRVPDSAECVRFAMTGNIDGMKALFVQGLASPQDVSATRGYSITRWAIYHHQYEMARFLVHAGADTDQNGAADKVWDKLLQGLISEQQEDVVRCLLDRSDFVDDQNFPPAHKIVLGLSFRSLEDLLRSDKAAVHDIDFGGRTALSWAAMRGDDHSVTTLLSYGADPNIVDKKHETALSCCCVTGRIQCARKLLEAGAHTKVILPSGIGKSSPMQCAAQYPTNDPLLLKTLIDFGADVNARNPEGETALHKIAQFTSAAHALVLLEHNAEPDVRDHNGKTPLIMAIIHNNHSVLRLLLSSWFSYELCPRSQHGPGLLHYIAKYADARTIRIFASAEHIKLHPDTAIAFGRSELETFRQRRDVDEELRIVFEDLLDVVGGERTTHGPSSSFATVDVSQQPHCLKTRDGRGDAREHDLKQQEEEEEDGEGNEHDDRRLGGGEESWYSPPETMRSSLASLGDFEVAEEGPADV